MEREVNIENCHPGVTVVSQGKADRSRSAAMVSTTLDTTVLSLMRRNHCSKKKNARAILRKVKQIEQSHKHSYCLKTK